MQKFTVLMAMAVFLAATLFMAVPGFAQAQGSQGGVCPRGYTPGTGPGGGGGGYCANPQAGSQYGPGYCNRNRNRARGSNNQAPANPNQNQPQTQTPAPPSGQ
jgi:hypothetical protein